MMLRPKPVASWATPEFNPWAGQSRGVVRQVVGVPLIMEGLIEEGNLYRHFRLTMGEVAGPAQYMTQYCGA